MQSWRGRPYRGRHRRGGPVGTTRGLSIPNPAPSVSPWELPEYDRPGRPANKNQRYPNFKRPVRPENRPYFKNHEWKKPKPSRSPFAPRPGQASGAPLAAGLTAAAWWALLFAGAAYVGWEAGERIAKWNSVGLKWAMWMFGYDIRVSCLAAPQAISTGSAWASCQPGIGQTNIAGSVQYWNGVTRPLQLSSRGDPGFLRQPTFYRGTRAVEWTRSARPVLPRVIPQPEVDPWEGSPDPSPWPSPAPKPNSQVDPWVVPPGVPWPAPAPVPWRALPDMQPNPWVSPEVQPQRGPDVRPNPWWPFPQPQPQPSPVEPVPQPQPQPQPSPARPPQVSPPVQVWPPVAPAPRPVPSPGPGVPPGVSPPVGNVGRPAPTHRLARPGPGTRERKGRVQSGGALLTWALNGATESMDLLSAFWWALPGRYRSPPVWKEDHWVRVTAQEMAADLWRNWRHIDLDQAAHNVVMNELGDRLAGQMGQAGRKAIRQLVAQGFSQRPVGFGTGPAL